MVTTQGEMELQIRCKRRCGFVVHPTYFAEHDRFAPGLCARCNAPLEIVEAYTDNVQPDLFVDTNPESRTRGRVIREKQQ